MLITQWHNVQQQRSIPIKGHVNLVLTVSSSCTKTSLQETTPATFVRFNSLFHPTIISQISIRKKFNHFCCTFGTLPSTCSCPLMIFMITVKPHIQVMGNIHGYLIRKNEIIRQPRYSKSPCETNALIQFPARKPL